MIRKLLNIIVSIILLISTSGVLFVTSTCSCTGATANAVYIQPKLKHNTCCSTEADAHEQHKSCCASHTSTANKTIQKQDNCDKTLYAYKKLDVDFIPPFDNSLAKRIILPLLYDLLNTLILSPNPLLESSSSIFLVSDPPYKLGRKLILISFHQIKIPSEA